MEHSTSAVQWKPLNTRKRAGELMRDSLAHVAMGADAINFFQWRQSASGAEAFHSAMVPHAGSDTKLFSRSVRLGAALKTLSDAGVQDTELKRADTAILFSAESEWATRSETLPSMKLNHWHDVRDWYRGYLDAGARADVVPLAYDWSGYQTIVLPTVIALSDEDTRRHRGLRPKTAVRSSSLCHRPDRRTLPHRSRRIPGAGNGLLRDMLGIRSEEFNISEKKPKTKPAEIGLSNGLTTRLWQNDVTSVAPDTRVLATYVGTAAADWELDGVPAITSHPTAKGPPSTWAAILAATTSPTCSRNSTQTAPPPKGLPTKGRVGERSTPQLRPQQPRLMTPASCTPSANPQTVPSASISI